MCWSFEEAGYCMVKREECRHRRQGQSFCKPYRPVTSARFFKLSSNFAMVFWVFPPGDTSFLAAVASAVNCCLTKCTSGSTLMGSFAIILLTFAANLLYVMSPPFRWYSQSNEAGVHGLICILWPSEDGHPTDDALQCGVREEGEEIFIVFTHSSVALRQSVRKSYKVNVCIGPAAVDSNFLSINACTTPATISCNMLTAKSLLRNWCYWIVACRCPQYFDVR